MVRDRNSKSLSMKILIAVVVILALFIIFMFLVRPGVNNYAYKNQITGANAILGNIVQTVQAQGYYAIPLGENQTLVLVPYQQPAQAGQ
ncbi:MAG: hypothetical protein KC516_03375 [Nanoarchaeota archaeon]|nr:hypothetical protein [Nanoarchaeota archaeon]